jgi:DNA polymerase delta subunit 1
MKTVLERRQWALKICANSFFGFLGVHKGGKMPLIEGAMSITAIGRQSITKVNNYIEKHFGGRIVYNDTDSSMADLGIQDPLEAVQRGKELADELTKLFPPPMKMEFEKAMRILCLKKKRYVAALIDEQTGELKLETKQLMFKGIELARRDRPKWLREVQASVIQSIMRLKGFEEAMDVVIDAVDDLVCGRIPHRDLITIKGLNASYKSKSYHMAVFAEELKKIGKPASPGERLEYIVVQMPGEKLLGKRMRLPEVYEQRLQNPEEREEIDYLYYIEKILMNPINQLISIAYKDTIASIQREERIPSRYRPTASHGYVGLEQPVMLIYRMILGGKDFRLLKQEIRHKLDEVKHITRSPSLTPYYDRLGLACPRNRKNPRKTILQRTKANKDAHSQTNTIHNYFHQPLESS